MKRTLNLAASVLAITMTLTGCGLLPAALESQHKSEKPTDARPTSATATPNAAPQRLYPDFMYESDYITLYEGDNPNSGSFYGYGAKLGEADVPTPENLNPEALYWFAHQHRDKDYKAATEQGKAENSPLRAMPELSTVPEENSNVQVAELMLWGIEAGNYVIETGDLKGFTRDMPTQAQLPPRFEDYAKVYEYDGWLEGCTVESAYFAQPIQAINNDVYARIVTIEKPCTAHFNDGSSTVISNAPIMEVTTFWWGYGEDGWYSKGATAERYRSLPEDALDKSI